MVIIIIMGIVNNILFLLPFLNQKINANMDIKPMTSQYFRILFIKIENKPFDGRHLWTQAMAALITIFQDCIHN